MSLLEAAPIVVGAHPCPDCTAEFDKKGKLGRHANSFHTKNDAKSECDRCWQSWFSPNQYHTHGRECPVQRDEDNNELVRPKPGWRWTADDPARCRRLTEGDRAGEGCDSIRRPEMKKTRRGGPEKRSQRKATYRSRKPFWRAPNADPHNYGTLPPGSQSQFRVKAPEPGMSQQTALPEHEGPAYHYHNASALDGAGNGGPEPGRSSDSEFGLTAPSFPSWPTPLSQQNLDPSSRSALFPHGVSSSQNPAGRPLPSSGQSFAHSSAQPKSLAPGVHVNPFGDPSLEEEEQAESETPSSRYPRRRRQNSLSKLSVPLSARQAYRYPDL